MSNATFTPIYTTVQSVKVRLAGKVQFQSQCPPLDGELPDDLLGQLIVDSETLVEQKLRGRYAIPFQSATTGTYAGLPDHTKRALRVVCDMRSVMMVLTTDFGRGTHIAGDEYAKDTEDAYDAAIIDLLGQDAEGKERKRFRFTPPLQDLLLAPTNREADDGFKGMLINTDSSRGGAEQYAEDHINNPSRSYIGTLPLGKFRRGGW